MFQLERGLGNLLRADFDTIWNTRTAQYWRRKEFLPPDCRGCDLADLCCRACPLYWDAVKDFAEIDGHTPRHAPLLEKKVWEAKRHWVGRVKGSGCVMSRTLAANELSTFLSNHCRQIAAAFAEIEQVQVEYQGAYTRFKADHDKTLRALTEKSAPGTADRQQ